MKISTIVNQAYQSALDARTRSHSPYSKFAVGAAIQLRGVATSISGCNIENASFGATICAERVALHTAVASHGKIQPEFLVVVTDEDQATVPCGLCLQSLAEFCPDSLPVYLGNTKGILKEIQFSDLLPQAFRKFEP